MEELDPKQTNRAEAFALWMRAPMPMVTLFKTLDVTRLAGLSRRRGLKFNLLLCWCAGKAASRLEEFYTLPVGDKLVRYENLAVNTVVALKNGDIATCDVPRLSGPHRPGPGDLPPLRSERRLHGHRHLRPAADRNRRRREHLRRVLQQPLSDLGQVPETALADRSARFLPVSPHPDGRRPRRPVSGNPPGGNPKPKTLTRP